MPAHLVGAPQVCLEWLGRGPRAFQMCGAVARYFWAGNPYEKAKFVCGQHKRAYRHVFPVPLPEKVAHP